MDEPTSDDPFSLFKDCVAQRVLQQTTAEKNKPDLGLDDSENDADGLDDFALYLASEAWSTLPEAVKAPTQRKLQNVTPSEVIDSIPLESTSASFIDSLIAYGIASDPEDALDFLRQILGDYLEQTRAAFAAHAAPPHGAWSSTRTSECEICEREVPLTYHHLVPRAVHEKALKRGWHTKAMLNKVAWLCRPCHSFVHRAASNEDLARYFHTIKLLVEREDVRKWRKYAAKQRFGVRRG